MTRMTLADTVRHQNMSGAEQPGIKNSGNRDHKPVVMEGSYEKMKIEGLVKSHTLMGKVGQEALIYSCYQCYQQYKTVTPAPRQVLKLTKQGRELF